MRCRIDLALQKRALDLRLSHFLGSSSKRRLELSSHLSNLFFSYLEYGPPQEGWQKELFQEVVTFSFDEQIEESLYCFGFDHFSPTAWKLFLPKGRFFLFSPCAHFWEDVRSEREQSRLALFWKNQGAPLRQIEDLQRSFEDTPPLLASWGKLGRATSSLLNDLSCEIETAYQGINPSSALGLIQREIISFEKQLLPLIPDGSVSLCLTGASPSREVEALLEKIVELSTKIPFSEMVVLSPTLETFSPLIHYLFSKRGIPYRISGTLIGLQSGFYQALAKIFDLIVSTWTSEKLITLLENPFFSPDLEEKERNRWISWIEKLFFFSPDWKEGFRELFIKTISLSPIPDRNQVGIGEMGLLQKLLSFLSELEADLISLKTALFTLADWGFRWESIGEKYLKKEGLQEIDFAAREAFTRGIKELKTARAEGVYPLEVIIESLLSATKGAYHMNHLHAVSFAPLEVGSIPPHRALFLIGMSEENFPRKEPFSSLNENVSLRPDRSEVDRYLFLQAILQPKEVLYISFADLSPDEGKEFSASLVVQDLLQRMGPAIEKTKVKPPFIQENEAGSLFFQVPPPSQAPTQRTIPLGDLVAFARHPWKYYLEKIRRIYPKDFSTRSFFAERAILLKGGLKWPLEMLTNNQIRLPPLFQEAFLLDLKEKEQDWQKQFRVWGKKQISLSLLQASSKDSFPPLRIGEGIEIVGEVPFALEDGALHFGDDQIGSLLKVWPEVLVAGISLQSPKIYFLKTGKIKEIQNPKEALAHFVDYFLQCEKTLSPLIPDWADRLLRKEKGDWSLMYEDEVTRTILAMLDPGKWEKEASKWGWLKESFSSLIDLYPSRRRSHETV